MHLNLSLLPGQAQFINDTTTRNLLLCGGYGSGKSYAGAIKAISLAFANPGGYDSVGILASKTMGTAKRTIIKQMLAILDQHKIKYTFNKSDAIFKVHVNGVVSEIHTVSAENWGRLVGMNASFFVFDEMDTMPADEARSAWQMLSSRVRKGKVQQCCAVTTPEGKGRFAHDYWVRQPSEKPELLVDRRLIQVSTYDSPYVTDEYIKSLLSNYSPRLIRAYLHGEFVNLDSGQVYYAYDRKESNTNLTVDHLPAQRPLIVGMDFNYNAMSAVVLGQFGDQKHDLYGRPRPSPDAVTAVVDELIGARNTTELIAELKGRYKNREIIVCPDASGGVNSTKAAGQTDFSLLQQAGFQLKYSSMNPMIKDRINSVNSRFLNAENQRRLLVNAEKAPILARCLETQVFDDAGKPTKGKKLGDTRIDVDGPLDALGYSIYQFFPLNPRATLTVA